MANKDQAERLLRAMSDVDDKYIEEALDTAAPASRRAVTTSLRRYSGMIGAVAAALILLVAGGVLIKYMSSSKTSEAVPAGHNAIVAEENGAPRMYDNSVLGGECATQEYAVDAIDSGAAGAATEAAEEIVEDDLCLRDSDTYDGLPFVLDSLDDLEEAAQLDFYAPESVNGSASCTYIYYVYENGTNIAEIQYLDEYGNPICAIRKAFVQRNISGSGDCYSVHDRAEADGIGSVDLLGNDGGYQVAYWIHGGYSYSVTTVEILSEDAMLELVSQVS